MITRAFLRFLLALNSILPLMRPVTRTLWEAAGALATFGAFLLAMMGYEVAAGISFVSGIVAVFYAGSLRSKASFTDKELEKAEIELRLRAMRHANRKLPPPPRPSAETEARLLSQYPAWDELVSKIEEINQ